MTYDPRSPDRRPLPERDAMSPTILAGLAVAIMLVIGFLVFSDIRSEQVASTPPATTTGQGQTNPPINAPAFERSVPDGTPGGQGTVPAPAPFQQEKR
jgi:hypothetical protein